MGCVLPFLHRHKRRAGAVPWQHTEQSRLARSAPSSSGHRPRFTGPALVPQGGGRSRQSPRAALGQICLQCPDCSPVPRSPCFLHGTVSSPHRGSLFSSAFPHSAEPRTVIVAIATTAAIVLIISKAVVFTRCPKSRDGESNCHYFFHPFQG